MKIAIVGSRGFDNAAIIAQSIRRWMVLAPEGLTIVSGGARGADRIGEDIAYDLSIPIVIHLPDWGKFGKSAGFIRNALIVRDADVVLAFFAPGPRSKGTADTVARAKLAGKAVYEYHEGAWYSHEVLAL